MPEGKASHDPFPARVGRWCQHDRPLCLGYEIGQYDSTSELMWRTAQASSGQQGQDDVQGKASPCKMRTARLGIGLQAGLCCCL